MAYRLRRCHECNFPLGNRDLFCPRCGAKQRRDKLALRRGHATRKIPAQHLP